MLKEGNIGNVGMKLNNGIDDIDDMFIIKGLSGIDILPIYGKLFNIP
jgi:hypothetical protein